MKPKLSRQDVEKLLYARGVTDKVALVGVRGYYLDSMGKRGANDRGVYDDAIFVVTPTRFEAFQANTDPSVFRKGIATLKAGVHRYYKGKHKNRYWALRLVGEQATVTRDGQTGDKIGIALNIHKGGVRNTGSEGCQTLKPADWDDFIEIVYDAMDDYEQQTIPYLLVDEIERRTADDKAIEPQRGIPAASLPNQGELENEAFTKPSPNDSGAAQSPIQIPTVAGGAAGESGTALCKERPSSFVRLWTVIAGAVGAVTGLGVNVEAIFERASEAITIRQILFAVFGLAIIALAMWFYDRSAERANRLNIQKSANAADPQKINTELIAQ